MAASAAVVVAGIAAPAYAANTAVTANPAVGPVGGGFTTTLSGTGAFPAASASVLAGRTTTSTTCPTTYGTSGTTVTATRTNDNAADATVADQTLAAGTYRLCIYGVAAGQTVVSASPLVATSDAITVSVANTRPVLSSTAGPIAGGNAVNFTGTGSFIGTASTVGAIFTTATCPTTYNVAPAGNFAATATKSSTSAAAVTVPAGLSLGSAYNVCLYNGTATNSALLGSSSATYSVLPPATLSPRSGSSGVASTITVQTTAANTFPASPTPGVTLTTVTCPATYAVGSGAAPYAATVRRISGTKLAATLPVTSIATTPGQATTDWNVCVYGEATALSPLLVAPVAYTVAPVLAITAPTPATGPAQGGTEVAITGTGFPFPLGNALLTVSIGGSALTDVRTTSATRLVGTTTARAAGPADISITTAAGTVTTSNTPFTFNYGINIAPNWAAPGATNITLDVLGAGFGALDFEDFPASGAPTADKAHVLLVDNSWFANNTGAPDEAFSDGGVVSECTGVTKIGLNEIICDLDLTKDVDATGNLVAGAVPAGTYTVVVVNDTDTLDATKHSTISSAATFTVAAN
ncbi:IPT/TIG domain-containing protein [Actinoplanes sp. TRM 88003]|uniref:IPT/TIG domain-containing protein n=1 Tax=Paractinoplanes aksuensis TaxID=2939490 RepID=A0ABT1DT70_9ACTN|nr:IPT/TIG domain-containing protein [Actinoplanes aksuensis]MCO8273175.1 IPT/TIG domain-containing protein [Actinoplanes aksuensis]